MDIAVLPLAITMMAGPQILSAIVLVTRERGPVRLSLVFLAGVAMAIVVGVGILYFGVRLLGYTGGAGGAATHPWVEIALAGLLIFLALRSYITRETSRPPAWLENLQQAGPGQILKIALLLIFLMPTDIVTMLTVAANLSRTGSGLVAALPFWLLTLLIAALPLLGYVTFHRRALVVMPKVRDWMTAHSWLVNIIVYVFFIIVLV